MTKYIKTGTAEFEQFDSHKWDLGLEEATRDYPVKGQYFRQKYEKARRNYCRETGVYNDTTRGIYCLTQKQRQPIESGDWIATGINGEHWSVKDEIFQKEYERLPVIPERVADYIESFSAGETDMDVINVSSAILGAVDYDQSNYIVADWIKEHGDDFARAWLDGYEVAEFKSEVTKTELNQSLPYRGGK